MNPLCWLRRLAPLTVLLLALFPVQASSQPQTQSLYQVPSVYLPALKRPPVSLNMKAIERTAMGYLPTYDGEPFQLNLREKKQVNDFPGAKSQIAEMFKQVGIQADLGSIKPAEKPVVNPGLQEDKKLNEYQKPYDEEFQDKLNRKLGKVSPKTIDQARANAADLKKQAQSKSTIFPFAQFFKDVQIENVQLTYIEREEGLSSINGNVFTSVRLTNQQRLKGADATGAAVKHVSRYAKVKGTAETMKPVLVIVPYVEGFRYAWKLVVEAEDGPYMVWVDAENGKVLQLLPQFFYDSARGLAFNPNPTAGTVEMSFEVDPPSGGKYKLSLSGQLVVHNSGADGVTSTDLTLADAGTGEANFNVSPLNGTAVERTSTAGYNSRFQEINAFAWLYRVRFISKLLGSQPLPAFTAYVNSSGNNAWSSGRFEIGNSTTSASTLCNPNAFTVDMFNSANDATVLTHEYGHNINGLQYGVGGGTMTGSINEGLADFWSCTIHNTDMFAAWWAHNCAGATETGFAPRQCEGVDVFPEHRYLGTAALFKESHSDAQMMCWALWNMRREYQEAGALGVLSTNVSLMKGMTTAGLGIIAGISDQRVHDSFVDLERQLVTNCGTSWYTEKIVSSFARAGLFLSDREAIIDIDDDYLNRTSTTPPTFTIWTGRDYTFSGGNTVTAGTLPFNTSFVVDVASDAAFTSNVFSSGTLGGVVSAAGGIATWQLTAAMWNTLKAGDKLYYRVRTMDGTGGNVRNSSGTGDGTVTGIALPFAVINDSGECECTCGTSSSGTSGSNRLPGGRTTATALLFAIPIAYAFYRKTRVRKSAR
jgi:hypothetical protein